MASSLHTIERALIDQSVNRALRSGGALRFESTGCAGGVARQQRLPARRCFGQPTDLCWLRREKRPLWDTSPV